MTGVKPVLAPVTEADPNCVQAGVVMFGGPVRSVVEYQISMFWEEDCNAALNPVIMMLALAVTWKAVPPEPLPPLSGGTVLKVI